MDILINQILTRATDIHTVNLKTRRQTVNIPDDQLVEGDLPVKNEVEFTLTLSGRMPLHLFDEEDQAEEDDADADAKEEGECGLKFINGSTT